jgi:MFS family permease
VADADVRTWPAPRATRVYYGWVVLGLAALAMVGTLPGRTQGLGLITEPLLRDLGISRVVYAQINLAATLLGASFCLGIGKWMDRHGSRVVLTTVVTALGLVVLAMSRVSSVAMLFVAVTLTRGIGQSALSIVSLAMVGKWFRRRLTIAMAVYALVMSIGFMLAFPAAGALILSRGWRVAWAVIGFCLLVGLAPLAWLLDRSSPEAIGLEVDGEPQRSDVGRHISDSTGLWAAVRSPAFWVVALASSAYGLIASGIGLFNESILAERGFPPDVYYTALAVTAITGLVGNFAAGAFADRGSLRSVLLAALVILSAGLVGLVHVKTVAHVMMQAVAMGVGGGFVMVVFFSFWGRAYGPAELGRIQGGAQAMTVLASAIGPLLLAMSVDATGSYGTAFYSLAVVVALLGVAAAFVPMPPGVRTSSHLQVRTEEAIR